MKRIVSVTEQIVEELLAKKKGDTSRFTKSGQPEPTGTAPARVLIVEDNEADAILMRRAVEKIGCVTEVAGDGRTALDHLNRHADPNFPDYDLVFLDIGLPGMDGIEVLRYIRTVAKDLHVILVSGSATKDQMEEAAKLGYFGYIEKPLKPEEAAEIFDKHKIPHHYDPNI